MSKTGNKKLTPISKVLRKNMTKEEKHLWYDYLKPLGLTIHRQKVILDYVVDFYVASSMLVIELDGIQHGDEEQAQKDRERDAKLSELGIRVLRYSNHEIKTDFKRVCAEIGDSIEAFKVD